jgi:lanosterol synthase
MVSTRSSKRDAPNGHANGDAKVNGFANGHANGHANGSVKQTELSHTNGFVHSFDKSTDRSKWRLKDEMGRHTWHYLEDEEQLKAWPQTTVEKHHLGLETGLPTLRPAKKPSEAVENGLQYYSRLQLPAGHWASEYGGPHFLIPGLVFAWYTTKTPIPEPTEIEMKNYIFATQRKDGGWGLHSEGESSVFGTGMYYVVLRILGASEEDPRLIKARGLLHSMGGAVYGPHWLKFWFSVLGLTKWEIVNPTPPELWLLPDWTPISPWRWWIHMRMIFLAMSFIASKRWTMEETPLIRQLRQEVLTEPYETINFGSHRNSITAADNYHPKSMVMNILNFLLVWIWYPILRTSSMKQRAEDWTWRLIQYEDANTDWACLAPVNAPMNTVACYIVEGKDSFSFQRHLYRLQDYCWMNKDGMLVNGTNGVQVWDTAFSIQAVVEAGLAQSPKWKPMLEKAHGYLEYQQITSEVPDREICYRASRKGAWAFSTKVQGYTVSDCTAEGLRAILFLQKEQQYPQLLSEERIQWAVDLLLTMQNAHSGGCSSYETQRGSEKLELLNVAEVFGNVMVEYDYVECTTAVVTVLSLFQKHSDYRSDDITRVKKAAVEYIKRAQRPDGSWYGNWGVCFTYAAMFTLESLASIGETYANSSHSKRGCDFLISHQMEDGGWGESYLSSHDRVWRDNEVSQVVHTAWTCIALMYAEYPDKKPIKRGLAMIMRRQRKNGEYLQESIEGVFNNSW